MNSWRRRQRGSHQAQRCLALGSILALHDVHFLDSTKGRSVFDGAKYDKPNWRNGRSKPSLS